MTPQEELSERCHELNPEALKCDGLDEAIVGISERFGQGSLLVYDVGKIIDILMTRDDMSHDEAIEWYEFNIVGAWMGDGTPIFMTHTKAGD
tara:strand:- start:56818 stop:57093 length:276 start_codon:yes stop_codon:yes gene_type:complete